MNQEEQKEELKKKCDKVQDFAGQTILDNEKIVDTQSLAVVIGLAILISKFPDLVCDNEIFTILKFVVAVSFVFSVLACLFVPTWFVHRRRCLWDEVDEIVKNDYKNGDDGDKLYTVQEIEEIEKKYLGCILPFPRVHILEFVRLVCVVVCVTSAVAVVVFLMYNTECMTRNDKNNFIRNVERENTPVQIQSGAGLRSQAIPQKMDKGLGLRSQTTPRKVDRGAGLVSPSTPVSPLAPDTNDVVSPPPESPKRGE